METATVKPIVTPRSIDWKKEIIVCLLLSLAFGIFICFASNKFLNRDARRAESVEMELSILHGRPFPHAGRMLYIPPWQNRIMFPALLEAGIHLGLFTGNGWYLIIRLAFSIAMFATFWLVLRNDAHADFKTAAIGLMLLAYCLVFTVTGPIEMTSDFPEAMFTAIFISLSLRRRQWLLLAVSVIAAANREASAFAGVIWFFLYAIDDTKKINWRQTGYAALISICGYGSAIAIRYAFGGTQAVRSNTQFLTLRGNYYHIKNFFVHPTPFDWPGLTFCFLLPGLLWIISNRKHLTLVHKRLLISAGAIAFISIFFGNIGDPRTFITSMILLIFTAVWAEMSCKVSETGHPDLALRQVSSGN